MAQTGQETVIVKGSATSFGFITEKNRLINEKKQQLISEGKEIVDIVEQPPSNSLGFKTQEVRIIWRTSNRSEKSKMGQSVAPLKVAVRKQLENVPVSSQNFDAILERVFIFLEDGEWERADFYCEQLLNFNPKSGVVYLGKLMAELKVNTKNGLKNLAEPFEDNANCVKASRFDSALAKKLKADNIFIRERNKAARRQTIYDNALSALSIAKTEAEYKTAALRFETISGFRDADEKVIECLVKAEISRKDEIYDLAAAKMNEDAALNSTAISFQLEAIKLFESIIDWKDSRAKIDECNKNIADIKIAEEKAEAERKRRAEEARIAAEKAKARNKKIAMIGGPIAAVLLVFIIVLNTVILPAANYKKALASEDAGNYGEAYSLFNKKPDYKDTKDRIAEAKLKEATALLDAKKYDEAYEILNEIGNKDAVTDSMYARATEYLEAKDYDGAYALLNQLGDTEKINESMYNRAVEFVNVGDKISAYMIFAKIPGYKDSDSKISEYKPYYLKNLLPKAKVGDHVIFGAYEQDNNTTNGKEDIGWRVLAKEGNKMLIISEYALDCQKYNTQYTNVTWETCSLRKWLNETFFKSAFSAEEQKMIPETRVTADANTSYGTSPGNDTTDKVFLLSITEAEKYFSSDEDRKCIPTAYAIEQGAYTSSSYTKGGKATCLWWLRSPGNFSYGAADVYYDGDFSDYGSSVNGDHGCVRPALWIEI